MANHAEAAPVQLAVQRMDDLRRKLLAEGWLETAAGVLERRDILGVKKKKDE
ncbi:hypothetical protein [Bradyrhizobium genosp. A]|uniref:hypothetical protein n=1 Tax=Bradyrhizobium genosp. A TaxID=83626 RepID=UPI003CE7F7ED